MLSLRQRAKDSFLSLTEQDTTLVLETSPAITVSRETLGSASRNLRRSPLVMLPTRSPYVVYRKQDFVMFQPSNALQQWCGGGNSHVGNVSVDADWPNIAGLRHSHPDLLQIAVHPPSITSVLPVI